MEAGNYDAINWQEHAWKTIEDAIPADASENNFDRARKQHFTSDSTGGWKAELNRYLQDPTIDVTKDKDTVQWWELFSRSGHISTDRHSCLGSDVVEWLEVLSYNWSKNVVDYAHINSEMEDDLGDKLHEYELMLKEETAFADGGFEEPDLDADQTDCDRSETAMGLQLGPGQLPISIFEAKKPEAYGPRCIFSGQLHGNMSCKHGFYTWEGRDKL
ncbi:hypothetical protein CERSUDRAFT_75409 [Gelatoporia subvermispora B]|uniref:HAT C-terminal dimerisation domain-containing protein n=1 Tax=Ceriporiopsis subvermispora (strain B) TaxID=914234 RepID=M2PGH6_CERS8|nr:hypothetical protein CERSUDRAFT_75409 [Gelatoporia subvermispora B]